jgi:MFS family permease
VSGRSPTWPLYVGGFLGPFGGAVVAVLIPELREAFDATTAQVAYSVPAYLVPFAALQLVSGTISERIGRRRVAQVAYGVYGAATVVAGIAPSLNVFLVARGLQGCANAFTTPIVLAALADTVAPERLGRAVGTFAGVQAGGISFAPLIGGVAAAINWRLAFVAPGIVAAALILIPPAERKRRGGPSPSLRVLRSRRIARLLACAFAGYLGFTGLPFLVSLRIDDAFALSSTARGVVLATYGAAGLVLGNLGGRVVERIGGRRTAAIAAVAAAVTILLVGIAMSAWQLAIWWTLGGAASALLWAGLNTLAVTSSEENRTGVVSVYQAFKFMGTAVAPFILLPLYDRSAEWAFGVAAVIVSTVVVLAPSDMPHGPVARATKEPYDPAQPIVPRGGT